MYPRFTAKIVAVYYGSLPQGDFVYMEFISAGEPPMSNPTAQQRAIAGGVQTIIQVIPFPLAQMQRKLFRMELHLTEDEYFSLPNRYNVGDYFDFSFNEKGALLIQPEATPEGRTP